MLLDKERDNHGNKRQVLQRDAVPQIQEKCIRIKEKERERRKERNEKKKKKNVQRKLIKAQKEKVRGGGPIRERHSTCKHMGAHGPPLKS